MSSEGPLICWRNTELYRCFCNHYRDSRGLTLGFLARQLQLGLSVSAAQRQSTGRGMHGDYTEPFLVKQESIWNTNARKWKGMSNTDTEENRGRWENSVQRVKNLSKKFWNRYQPILLQSNPKTSQLDTRIQTSVCGPRKGRWALSSRCVMQTVRMICCHKDRKVSQASGHVVLSSPSTPF